MDYRCRLGLLDNSFTASGVATPEAATPEAATPGTAIRQAATLPSREDSRPKYSWADLTFYFLPLFLSLISALLFPRSSVRENTRA